jgi:hypothetical protein
MKKSERYIAKDVVVHGELIEADTLISDLEGKSWLTPQWLDEAQRAGLVGKRIVDDSPVDPEAVKEPAPSVPDPLAETVVQTSASESQEGDGQGTGEGSDNPANSQPQAQGEKSSEPVETQVQTAPEVQAAPANSQPQPNTAGPGNPKPQVIGKNAGKAQPRSSKSKS